MRTAQGDLTFAFLIRQATVVVDEFALGPSSHTGAADTLFAQGIDGDACQLQHIGDAFAGGNFQLEVLAQEHDGEAVLFVGGRGGKWCGLHI